MCLTVCEKLIKSPSVWPWFNGSVLCGYSCSAIKLLTREEIVCMHINLREDCMGAYILTIDIVRTHALWAQSQSDLMQFWLLWSRIFQSFAITQGWLDGTMTKRKLLCSGAVRCLWWQSRGKQDKSFEAIKTELWNEAVQNAFLLRYP